jgi:hypothetical protein
MNPFGWSKEAQLALAIFTAIGGACGFAYYYATRGHGITANSWIEFGYFGAADEVLFGAAIGGALAYAAKLIKN